MKNYIKAAVFTLACVAGTGAIANPIYNYSYTFSNGSVVTGSFNGDANGDIVTNLTNITASLNGTAFAASYGTGFNQGMPVSGGAQASFSGNGNNFMFADQDYATTYNYVMYFRYLSGSVVDTFNISTMESNVDWPEASAWSLVQVNEGPADVPEPGGYALMLAGAGVMGLALRRRKASKG